MSITDPWFIDIISAHSLDQSDVIVQCLDISSYHDPNLVASSTENQQRVLQTTKVHPVPTSPVPLFPVLSTECTPSYNSLYTQGAVKAVCETGDEYVENQNKNYQVVEKRVGELKKLWEDLNSDMERRGNLIEVV